MNANPVLNREFLASLRTPRALAVAVVYLFLLTGLVALMWPAQEVYTMAAASSQKLFVTLSFFLLAVICLCAPAFTSVAITREYERNTYEQLHYTLLRPNQIIFGKLVAGLGYVLILIVASLPMMGACFILGGVGLLQVLQVYLVVTVAGLFFGLVGLFCSAYARSSYRSLLSCYAIILAVAGVSWIPSVVLGLWAQRVHLIHLVRGVSPFAALVSIIQPGRFAAEHPVTPGFFGTFCDSIWPFVFFAPLAAVLFYALLYARIVRPPQSRQRGNTRIIEDRYELMKRHVKFPFYLFDPRKRKRMIGRVLNLVLVKEMRSKAFGRSLWVIRSMYIALFVSLILAFLPLTQVAKIGIDTIAITCVSLPLGVIILITPVLTATAITEEHEKGIFDMLRSTLVSAWEIVMGKLQMAWFFLGLLILSMFPTYFVLAYISAGPADMRHISEGVNLIRPFRFKFAAGWAELSQVEPYFISDMLAALAVVVLAMIFATCIGMVCSAFSRRSSVSAAVAYVLTIAWAVGTFIPYLVAEKIPDVVVKACMTANPFVAAANAVAPETFAGVAPRLWLDSTATIVVGIVVQRTDEVFRKTMASRRVADCSGRAAAVGSRRFSRRPDR